MLYNAEKACSRKNEYLNEQYTASFSNENCHNGFAYGDSDKKIVRKPLDIVVEDDYGYHVRHNASLYFKYVADEWLICMTPEKRKP